MSYGSVLPTKYSSNGAGALLPSLPPSPSARKSLAVASLFGVMGVMSLCLTSGVGSQLGLYSSPATASFDYDLSKDYFDLSKWAYCSEDTLKDRELFRLRKGDNLKVVESDLDAFAYILDSGEADSDEPVKLVFRGSGTSLNVITDLLTWKTTDEGLCTGCSIHTGFYNVWSSIEEQVMSQMEKYGKDKNIVAAGHSLGGAMAAIASLILVEKGYENVECYTFGKPRVGNKDFADFYNEKLREWRVVNKVRGKMRGADW